MSSHKKEKPFERNPGLKHNKAVGYPIGDYGNLSKQRNMDRHMAAEPQGMELYTQFVQCISSRISINIIPGETPADDSTSTMRLAVLVYLNDSKGMAGKCPDIEVINEAGQSGLPREEKDNIINYCIECFSANNVGNPEDLPPAPAAGDWVLVKPPADGAPDDICIYYRIDDPGEYSVAPGRPPGPSSRAPWGRGNTGIPVVAETYPPAARASLLELATNSVTEATSTGLPCMVVLPDITYYSAAGGKHPVFPIGASQIGRAMDNHGGNKVDWPSTYIRPVVSMLDGTITTIADGSPNGACGGEVRISYTVNSQNLTVVYCHLSTMPNDDELNQPVTRGQVIGMSGGVPGSPGAGRTTGNHLHTAFLLDGASATNEDIKELLGWDLLAANNYEFPTPTQAFSSCRDPFATS